MVDPAIVQDESKNCVFLLSGVKSKQHHLFLEF